MPSDKGLLLSELEELNRHLRRRYRAGGTIRERRGRARERGVFASLRRLSRAEIRDFFGERTLGGVDGSLVTTGAGYPYVVTLFRALARTTGNGGGRRIWAEELFSPLLPRFQESLQAKLEQGLGAEEAMAHLRWGILAQLEARVCAEALAKERPRLMLLDGGFARLEKHAPQMWGSLKAAALDRDVVILGVTEEIASRSLAKALWGDGLLAEAAADREVLFGLLQPGETYLLEEEGTGEKGRIYVRFAGHPQVVAVDYLTAQEKELAQALNFLYTITPAHGRGFPLWLDVVDNEVRLTGEYVEALLAASLEPAMAEVFLRPLRANREL
ncbi:MAG: hypothetical protein PWQ99_210 [Clostridia bacterium]|nr:hypothetical protein [Clostridia bacterium]MDN5375208.1 hypothetical protein [Thermacetogenium sp.]